MTIRQSAIRRIMYPALLTSALLLPAAAMAQTQTSTANLNVSLTINKTCAINDQNLTFDPQIGLNTNVDNNAQFSVTCTNGLPYKVGFGLGLHAQGTQRRMRMNDGSSNFVEYQIYKDSNRTQILDAVGGSGTISAKGNGNAQSIDVYGRVPPQPNPPAGTYTDIVLVTMAY